MWIRIQGWILKGEKAKQISCTFFQIFSIYEEKIKNFVQKVCVLSFKKVKKCFILFLNF